LWMLKIGLFLYDFLSSFQNRPHSIANRKQTLLDLPGLRDQGLKGAGIYYDAVVDDEKLSLAILQDGLKNTKCRAFNRVSLVDLKVPQDGSAYHVTVKNEVTGEISQIQAKHVVFATGPFTDQVLSHISDLKWKPCLLPSKGSHL